MSSVWFPGAEFGIDRRRGVPTKDVVTAIQAVEQDPGPYDNRYDQSGLAIRDLETIGQIVVFDTRDHLLIIGVGGPVLLKFPQFLNGPACEKI